MIEDISYPAHVVLVRELHFAEPDKLGEHTTVVPLAAVVDDDGEPDLALILAQMPAASWGWFFLDRFSTSVDHNGNTYDMTSGPVRQTGTTFVDARALTLEEVYPIYEQQQRYIAGRRKSGKPIAALPHGKDRSLIVQALQRGEHALVTRNGENRWWHPDRDVLIESASVG